MEIARAIYGGWYAGIALLAILAVTLGLKRMWEKFPFFTAYVAVVLLQATVTLSLQRNYQAYMYAHGAFESVGMLLGLCVAYEVFKNIFAPYAALRGLANTVFQITIVVLTIVGCIVMYTHSPVAGSRFNAAFLVVEEGVRIVEVGVLISLFAFSGAFGLHWRQNIFGIALGLAVFATVELTAITLRAHMGPNISQIMGLARSFSYDFSLLVWLGYLLAPERVTSTVVAPEKGQLEQWNQAVKELIYQ